MFSLMDIMVLWHESLFRITEGNNRSPVHPFILHMKGQYVELWWFLWYQPQQVVEQTVDLLFIWDTTMLIGRHM